MSKLSLIAKLTIDPANADAMDAALVTMCEAANEEAGLEVYAANKDSGAEGVYWFFELYTNNDALGVHGQGDGMKAAMGALGGLLAGPPEISMCAPVAAKGLDV